MGGTKIFVFQLKEIVRTAVFAIIGIALIIALVYLFIPRDRPSGEPNVMAGRYIPGTYISQIILNGQPVNVEVTVDSDKILAIELTNMAEIQEVFYPLMQPTMKQLTEQIIRTQSLNIQTTLENAITSQVLLSAVRQALDKAEADIT